MRNANKSQKISDSAMLRKWKSDPDYVAVTRSQKLISFSDWQAQFVTILTLSITSSAAVAKRPDDASCHWIFR